MPYMIRIDFGLRHAGAHLLLKSSKRFACSSLMTKVLFWMFMVRKFCIHHGSLTADRQVMTYVEESPGNVGCVLDTLDNHPIRASSF